MRRGAAHLWRPLSSCFLHRSLRRLHDALYGKVGFAQALDALRVAGWILKTQYSPPPLDQKIRRTDRDRRRWKRRCSHASLSVRGALLHFPRRMRAHAVALLARNAFVLTPDKDFRAARLGAGADQPAALCNTARSGTRPLLLRESPLGLVEIRNELLAASPPSALIRG